MNVVPGHHYLAFVLTDTCRNEILSTYPLRHEVVKCDHVTIAYPVKEENIAQLQELVDAKPRIYLHGFVEADGIDLFKVFIDYFKHRVDGKRLDGEQYHLTYTRNADMASSDSNKVLGGEIIATGESAANMQLHGEFKLVPIA